jgi:hypothetical protein
MSINYPVCICSREIGARKECGHAHTRAVDRSCKQEKASDGINHNNEKSLFRTPDFSLHNLMVHISPTSAILPSSHEPSHPGNSTTCKHNPIRGNLIKIKERF